MKSTVLFVQFFAMNANDRWALCRELHGTEFPIQSLGWKPSTSAALFLSDAYIEILEAHIPILEPTDKYIFGEIRSILRAMIDLPSTYSYIWFQYLGEPMVTGHGVQMWDVVERLSIIALKNFPNPITFSNHGMLDMAVEIKRRYQLEKERDASAEKMFNQLVPTAKQRKVTPKKRR